MTLIRKKILVGLLTAGTVLFSGCKAEKDTGNATGGEPVKEIPDTLPWSERMALSVMKRNPQAYRIDRRTEPEWDYVHGLALTAFGEVYKETGKANYFAYIKGYADGLIGPEGRIKTYELTDYNMDMINAGKLLFELYEKTGEEKYLKAMRRLRKQLEEQPRTASGGFWHKKRYPDQMWLDGLYMGAPFYARYTVTFEKGERLFDVVKQFALIQEHARDEKTGLLYHGWDESGAMAWADKETGTSPNFWSRSLGWYAMALVDVLEYIPAEHPGRERLTGYLTALAEAVAEFQGVSGLWYQVTDMGHREGNYLEASGSAMFSYALAKGVNRGYLPERYRKVAERAFNGLVNELIKIDKDGELHLTQVCAVAGLGGDPYRDGSYAYYINERKQDNDPKGTGPFILAALELNR